MSDYNFTKQTEDDFWNIHYDENDYSGPLNYINAAEHFRSFSVGLTDLICKKGYTKDINDLNLKTDFVYEKYTALDKISKSTIKDWFLDSRRPDVVSSSREKMFILCFALGLSFEETCDFFYNVYFDRTFNCKDIKEAVYYYCMRRCLDFFHAKKLIDTIFDLNKKVSHACNQTDTIYTRSIVNAIDNIETDEELINFIVSNPSYFLQHNQSALENVKELLSRIKGSKEDKAVFQSLKNKNSITKNEADKIYSCGYVVQECIKYSDVYDATNLDISSNDFMLWVILGGKLTSRADEFSISFSKDANITKLIRKNFPSKKTLSDILNGKAVSFDAIRKLLILLKFYEFWFPFFSDMPNADIPPSERFDTYKSETDDILTDSGFYPLYFGNPYDWLFLYSSNTDNPLDTFRGIIDYSINPE